MTPSKSDLSPRDHGPLKHLIRKGAEITYRVIGHGPAIVLIPSLGRGSEDFDGLCPLLAQAGLRVILPEPRGIEASSPLSQADTLHDMAADIAAIIEAEHAAPAVLVGHAAGNWVARVLAHDRPDLARAVALAAAIVTDAVPEGMRASISASFDMALSDQERLGHLARVYFAPGADASVWLSGWWPDVAATQRSAAKRTTNKAWLRVADTHPTLYIGAADDVISPPPTTSALRDALGPKASCVVIENAGHALLPEQPKAVADHLASWVQSLPPLAT